MEALITIQGKGAAKLTVRRIADEEVTHESILQPGEELAVSFTDEPVILTVEGVEDGGASV